MEGKMGEKSVFDKQQKINALFETIVGKKNQKTKTLAFKNGGEEEGEGEGEERGKERERERELEQAREHASSSLVIQWLAPS